MGNAIPMGHRFIIAYELSIVHMGNIPYIKYVFHRNCIAHRLNIEPLGVAVKHEA